MQITTRIKLLLLIFGYVVVLFHGALPHCHASETSGHHYPHHHSTANHHHGADEHNDEDDHEQLSHDDGLHKGYVKSNSIQYFALEIPAELMSVHFAFAAPLADGDNACDVLNLSQRVRRGLAAAHTLRGPPAC